MCTAVVGSARAGLKLDAGSDREDRSSDVRHVGDARWSFSATYDDSILHTHHLCRLVSHCNIEYFRTAYGILGGCGVEVESIVEQGLATKGKSL